MSILRDFEEVPKIKCQFCGTEIPVKGGEYGKNCPRCGGTINMDDARSSEWERLKAQYEDGMENQ